MRGLVALDPGACANIYGDELLAEIGALVELVAPPLSSAALAQRLDLLADVDVLLSGWGAPRLDEALLAAAPKLAAVFYGAGSVRGLVTDAVWERGLALSSAWEMNAVPVAEFTIALVFLCLKRTFEFIAAVQANGPGPRPPVLVTGAYRSKLGIISLGAIGRLVCERLRPFDLDILAYDPFAPDEVFARLGVRRADLDTVFAECDVVSLHTPNLPSTRGMITGAHFAAMKPDASFINTSRGDVVREPEMAAVLAVRPDLWACLDVLAEIDKSAQPQLYALPNVTITPHIAGSMGPECRRMGRAMVDELRRWLAGEPLRHQVTRARFELMA